MHIIKTNLYAPAAVLGGGDSAESKWSGGEDK